MAQNSDNDYDDNDDKDFWILGPSELKVKAGLRSFLKQECVYIIFKKIHGEYISFLWLP